MLSAELSDNMEQQPVTTGMVPEDFQNANDSIEHKEELLSGTEEQVWTGMDNLIDMEKAQKESGSSEGDTLAGKSGKTTSENFESGSGSERTKGGKGGKSGKWRIFVTKIPENLNSDDLGQYFQQFGVVEDLFVPLRNPHAKGDRSHKNIAFVSYRDQTAYEEVLSRREYEVKAGIFVVVDTAMTVEKGHSKGKDSNGWNAKGKWGGGKDSGKDSWKGMMLKGKAKDPWSSKGWGKGDSWGKGGDSWGKGGDSWGMKGMKGASAEVSTSASTTETWPAQKGDDWWAQMMAATWGAEKGGKGKSGWEGFGSGPYDWLSGGWW